MAESLEGEILRHAADGTLLERAHFVQGLLEGEVTSYGPGGEVLHSAQFKGGQLEGPMKAFQSGKLIFLAHFKGGKPNGEVTVFDKDGKPLSTEYYEEGARVEKRPEPPKIVPPAKPLPRR